jgi:nucleoid DNA-binding protein
LGLDKSTAEAVVELFLKLMKDSLTEEGKVVLKNIGTLEMKIIPARVTNNFGIKKKVPSRFKVKFTQSRNFALGKEVLDNDSSVLGDLQSLVKAGIGKY